MSKSPSLYRTYSSPNLRASKHQYSDMNNCQWESQKYKYGYDDSEDDGIFFIIGDRVYVDGFRPASVAYFGEVEFASGDWVGVVLDMPTGNHDGRIHGRQYFQCSPMHGLFVRPNRVTRIPDSAFGSASSTSSRQLTPLPTTTNYNRIINNNSPYQVDNNSKSPATSSIMESYIYDDDYRREPNVLNLEQKLKSIDNNNSYLNDYNDRPSLKSTGILKKLSSHSRSHSTEPSTSRISLRADELVDRIKKVTQPSAISNNSVFNFRPKRSQLSEYENDYSYDDYRSIRRSKTPDLNKLSKNNNNESNNKRVDLSSKPICLGDHVIVRTERGNIEGILRFLGETNFATGQWAGVQLYKPEGKNDGSVLGFRYFNCPQNYGLFVPASRITKQLNEKTIQSDFNTMRSTLKSPPPPKTKLDYFNSFDNNNYRYNNSPTGYYDRTPSSASSSAYSSSYSTGLPKNQRQQQQNLITSSSTSSSPITTSNSRLFSDTPLPKSSKNYNIPSKLNWNELIDKNEYSFRKPKFDDKDLDFELKRSLSRSSMNLSKPLSTSIRLTEKPKSVQYTFTSSKYDGNPIARRTIIYN